MNFLAWRGFHHFFYFFPQIQPRKLTKAYVVNIQHNNKFQSTSKTTVRLFAYNAHHICDIIMENVK